MIDYKTKNVNSFIQKIINAINLINDFNNIVNNQINISSIELITQKNPLMSLNINYFKKQLEESPDDSIDTLDKIIPPEEEPPDLPIPTNNLSGKEKILRNLLNQLELLTIKNNLLKKRFKEMQKQINEIYQDLQNKSIHKNDLEKSINIFKEEINSLKNKLYVENQDIRKTNTITNELKYFLTLISAKIHYQLNYYITDQENLKINDIKKEIKNKFDEINKFSKRNKKLYDDIKNNITKIEKNIKNQNNAIYIKQKNDLLSLAINYISQIVKNYQITNKFISNKLNTLENIINLIYINKNLYEKTQNEIEEDFNNIHKKIENQNIKSPLIEPIFLKGSMLMGIKDERIKNYSDHNNNDIYKKSKILIQNWEEKYSIFDKYDEHDIKYELKAVGLKPGKYYRNLKFDRNYTNKEILDFKINGKETKIIEKNNSFQFLIYLENLQSNQVHLKYKEFFTEESEEEQNFLLKKRSIGLNKDLAGERAKFTLIIEKDYDIISFEESFLIKNDKNEYTWEGTVPHDGINTIITISRLQGIISFSFNQQIKNTNIDSIDSQDETIIIPTPFIGGNNNIMKITCNENRNKNIIINEKKCEITFNEDNPEYELEIKGELINKCKGEWICDLTDEEIENNIPEEYKDSKDHLKQKALKIIKDYDRNHKNEQVPDIVKIGKWINKNIENNNYYTGNYVIPVEEILDMKIGDSYHITQAFNALIYSLGYQVIFISGFMLKSNNLESEDEHYWSLIKINEKWLPFDAKCGFFSGKLPISHVFYRFFENLENENENIELGEANISLELKNIKFNLKNQLEKLKIKSNLLFQNIYQNFFDILEYISEIEEYIGNEKEIISNHLLSPQEAIEDNQNYIIRFLGYLGSELFLKYNIKTYIEKKPTNTFLRDITIKILSTGLVARQIYKINIIDYTLIKTFKNDIRKWYDFLLKLKDRFKKLYGISDDINIIFFGHNFTNLQVNMLIFNQNNNNKIRIIENKEKNQPFKIKSYNVLKHIILSSNIFNNNYSKNKNEWSKTVLYRGGMKYYPPYDWIGLALKIDKKYENYSNTWLGKQNIKGEWPVAYHGINRNVLDKILNTINNNLKLGFRYLYKDVDNFEENKNNYSYCDEGIYFYPDIDQAKIQAEPISLGNSNTTFQFIIMARINPNKIRGPGVAPANWIVNPNDDEVRPYRLLIKENYNKSKLNIIHFKIK